MPEVQCDVCGQIVPMVDAAIHIANHFADSLDRALQNPALVPVPAKK